MESSFYTNNRNKLFSAIEDSSAVILLSGAAPVKAGDEFYPFTPSRNFYYMTGLDDENIILLMCKKDDITQTTLFIARPDPIAAKWTGETVSADDAEKISGISDIKYRDDFESSLSSVIFNKRLKNVYLDLENRDISCSTQAIKLSERIKSGYPYVNILNVYDIIAEFRKIKEPCEISEIEKAIEITKKGIYSMMKNAKAGMAEYEIEAYFDFELKKNGVKDFAFKTIAASGKNAAVLHYSSNDGITGENDLILCDLGAQWHYYNGDITRTFPVNGRFTPRQKEIYNTVLEGQKKVISAIRPGIEFRSLNTILIDYYEKALKELGLIKDKSEVGKYYYHGVSHSLGLETHDAGRHNEGLLEAGMVFTVEPGLYIEEEGIGIRIEDNVLVTDDGCRVLSDDIIKEADDIENFMAGKLK